MKADYSSYDRSLESMAAYGPILSNGLVNHAPMLIEALARLGKAENLGNDRQAHGFTLREQARKPVTIDNWPQALGDSTRYSDWRLFFRKRLQYYSWQAECRKWVVRLLPGAITAAFHGLLRVAHSVRALQLAETDARKNEFADALAMWAAYYREIPLSMLPLRNELSIAQALHAVPDVPEAYRPARGFIVAGIEQVVHTQGFAQAVASVSFQGNVRDQLDALVIASADLLLKHARSDYTAIVFTHAVTSSAALQTFQAVLPESTLRLLLLRVWQGICALKSAFATFDRPRLPEQYSAKCDTDVFVETFDVSPLVRAAINHGDDHVIKLTEACVSSWQRSKKPCLLAAADRVRQLLPAT